MPVELSWLLPQRIIIQRFQGEVSVEQIKDSQAIFLTWLDTGTPPVHYVGDFTQIANFPKFITDIRGGLTYTGNPNLGWIMLVTNNNRLLNYFVSMITQLVTRNQRFKVCASLDEALEFLRRHDATLIIPSTIDAHD